MLLSTFAIRLVGDEHDRLAREREPNLELHRRGRGGACLGGLGGRHGATLDPHRRALGRESARSLCGLVEGEGEQLVERHARKA